MDNFSVAIIKPNRFWDNVKGDRDKLQSSTVKDVENEIADIVELRQVTPDTMMECIIDTIKLTKELMGSTSMCYEDNNYVYQLCHLNMSDNGKEGADNEDDINLLASHLCLDDVKIYGSVIILRSKIDHDNGNTCITDTLNITDISELLYKKFVHKGVKVYTNGSVDEFTFINNPLESMSDKEIDRHKWIELPFLNFNLIGFIKMDLETDHVNKKITRLVGSEIVNGTVILVSKSTETEYIDLDRELFNKMIAVANGPMENRKLTEEENKNGDEQNSLPIVMNRHCILENRYKNYKLECNYCSKEIGNNNSLVCTGCYRVKYDDPQCQKDDWENHKKECLHEKKSLNIIKAE
jgi:hypothetical protein